MKKKIAEIKEVTYGAEGIIFKFSKEEIENAIRKKDFEKRSFQGDLDGFNNDWSKGAKDFGEYAERQRISNIKIIANFVNENWREPILLCRDGNTILDGGHRHLAAKHSGKEEIDVIVTDAPVDITDAQKKKLWAAITKYKDLEKALSEAGIQILKK